MNGFDALIGHDGPVELLRRMAANDRVPHALLFHGPQSVGKATAAAIFAAALLCESGEGDPCGACQSCRLIATGGHPDLTRVGRLPKTESATAATGEADVGELRSLIVVSQVRSLSQLAALSPRQSRRRVFVIDPADRMNHEAQNALLKTLEEPPGAAVLVLVAARPHLLLPTVRSRSFAVGFAPMPTDELARRLEERGVPRAESILRAGLAEGRVGAALDVDLDERSAERDRVLSALEALASGRGIADLPPTAAELAGRDETDFLAALDLVQGLLRDAARTTAAPDRPVLVHADLADRLGRLGRTLGPRRAAELVGAVDRVRGQLRINANRVLLAEALLADVATRR